MRFSYLEIWLLSTKKTFLVRKHNVIQAFDSYKSFEIFVWTIQLHNMSTYNASHQRIRTLSNYDVELCHTMSL